MNNSKKKISLGIWIIFCTLSCFLLIEIFIRVVLFSGHLKIAIFRDPARYGDFFSDDDYWKLYYRLGREFEIPTPDTIHPILGWSQTPIDEGNPLGLLKESLDGLLSKKNKILFFGDSFVRGTPSSSEFEIPRYMTSRLKANVVIDLSCGGYGLDQMFLLFSMIHEKVKKPFVIFGILIEDDLDRSILSLRQGQKPYFIVENAKLVLKGVPIDPDPKHYYAVTPPQVRSYAFRLILRVLSNKTHFFARRLARIEEKIKINSRIINDLSAICKKRNYSLLFVLFHGLTDLKFGGLWQEKFIKDELEKLKIPYIDTRDFLKQYAIEHKIDLSDFYELSTGGHHNNLGNQVIAEGLLNYLSQKYGLK